MAWTHQAIVLLLDVVRLSVELQAAVAWRLLRPSALLVWVYSSAAPGPASPSSHPQTSASTPV